VQRSPAVCVCVCVCVCVRPIVYDLESSKRGDLSTIWAVAPQKKETNAYRRVLLSRSKQFSQISVFYRTCKLIAVSQVPAVNPYDEPDESKLKHPIIYDTLVT
jgi:hypothetical protein